MSFTLFGVNLLGTKKLIYSINKLYGINIKLAKQIIFELGFSPNLIVNDLTAVQGYMLAKKIKDDCMVEGNLEEMIKKNILVHINSGSQRGYRIRTGLPVRGQSSHSNGKTARRRLQIGKLLFSFHS